MSLILEAVMGWGGTGDAENGRYINDEKTSHKKNLVPLL
jgi:hypothetical protein